MWIFKKSEAKEKASEPATAQIIADLEKRIARLEMYKEDKVIDMRDPDSWKFLWKRNLFEEAKRNDN